MDRIKWKNIWILSFKSLGTKNSVKQSFMAEVCKNSPPLEVVTMLELDSKVDKKKINIEVKDNRMTKLEKYHRLQILSAMSK